MRFGAPGPLSISRRPRDPRGGLRQVWRLRRAQGRGADLRLARPSRRVLVQPLRWVNFDVLADDGIHWGWLEMVKARARVAGQTSDRVVPLEGEDYRPGLDNPVDINAMCSRFYVLKRAHVPDATFMNCVYCEAPLLRPSEET